MPFSEMVLNLLKNRMPIHPITMAKLRRYKSTLRELGRRKNSLKRRKQHLLKQKRFWILARVTRSVSSMPRQEKRLNNHKENNAQLMKMLQDANTRIEELVHSVNHWHKAYENLYQDHFALECEIECDKCREERENTPETKTYLMCEDCSATKNDLKKKVKKLEKDVNFWQTVTNRNLRNILKMTEEVMYIPTRELEQLIQSYKGEITDNALLNKAGRLAAESHLLLKDKRIPNSIAVKKIKP